MNLSSAFNLAWLAVACAALIGCASTPETGPAAVVRARAPEGYEKTISSYFAFKVRGPKSNVEISVDKPEPSDCPLDGYATSARGWVVPVVYATRTGALTGKETININAKQYYFWFSGNNIAGITPRIELCPGSVSGVSEVAQTLAASESVAALAATARGQGGDAPGTPEPSTRAVSQDRVTVPVARKRDATKKAGESSGTPRRAATNSAASRKKPAQ